MTDLHYRGLIDVSERVRNRALRSEAVVEHLLDRIRRLEPSLNAFVRVLGEQALADARRADKEIDAGLWRGPLHGIPVAIKDLLHMTGLPTTAGMKVHENNVAKEDATVVKRLKRAGAIPIGKVRTTEGAGLEHHPTMPRPANPWNVNHWTGVSSSGSAVAVAAGLSYGALGTDTGGSIRMPSMSCGLTGLKPTWGRVSRHGLMPLAESFDHIGPIGRSASDVAVILQAIAGADSDDPTALREAVPDYGEDGTLDLGGIRIGIDRAYALGDVDGEVAAGVEAALAVFRELGASVRDVKFPETQSLIAEVMPLMLCEVAAAHEETYPKRKDAYGPSLAQTIDSAGFFRGLDVAKSNLARARFTGRLRALYADVDLLIAPGMPVPAPPYAEVDAMLGNMDEVARKILRFCYPFNASQVPTLSLPAGFTKAGLPVGFQLIGDRLAEPLLLRAGRAFQRRTDFHTCHPAI